MTGCMILQICNMYKADTPAKIGLVDDPLTKLRGIVYREALNGETWLTNPEAAYKANKLASKVIIYPLNNKQ